MRPGGFEPPTNSLEGCCSIHLSYGRQTRAVYNLTPHCRPPMPRERPTPFFSHIVACSTHGDRPRKRSAPGRRRRDGRTHPDRSRPPAPAAARAREHARRLGPSHPYLCRRGAGLARCAAQSADRLGERRGAHHAGARCVSIRLYPASAERAGGAHRRAFHRDPGGDHLGRGGRARVTLVDHLQVTARLAVSEEAAKRAEAVMREARDLAERLARARSAFLANMSHEIRTPMNAVLGFVELILDTELSTEQRRALELVR